MKTGDKIRTYKWSERRGWTVVTDDIAALEALAVALKPWVRDDA